MQVTSLTAPFRSWGVVKAHSGHAGTTCIDRNLEYVMRMRLEAVLLLVTVGACAGNRNEEEVTTRETTDTLVTRKQVVDTMVVKTEATVATDTTIVADTTIAADTTVTADTTVASDTTRIGDEGVISVDTTSTR